MASNEERRVKIMEYVIERQKSNQKTTKTDVIRHMKQEKLSSGETTYNLIQDLISEEKLNVEVINSQVHFLSVNEKFDFLEMLNEYAKSKMEEALKPYGSVLRTGNVEIKIRKRRNSKEVDFSVTANELATKEEMDTAVKESAAKYVDRQKKRTSSRSSEKSD